MHYANSATVFLQDKKAFNVHLNKQMTMDAKRMFFFHFLYFNTAHSNLGPGQLASILHVKQIGIIAKELRKRKFVFWNDVFVAVVIVVVA